MQHCGGTENESKQSESPVRRGEGRLVQDLSQMTPYVVYNPVRRSEGNIKGALSQMSQYELLDLSDYVHKILWGKYKYDHCSPNLAEYHVCLADKEIANLRRQLNAAKERNDQLQEHVRNERERNDNLSGTIGNFRESDSVRSHSEGHVPYRFRAIDCKELEQMSRQELLILEKCLPDFLPQSFKELEQEQRLCCVAGLQLHVLEIDKNDLLKQLNTEQERNDQLLEQLRNEEGRNDDLSGRLKASEQTNQKHEESYGSSLQPCPEDK